MRYDVLNFDTFLKTTYEYVVLHIPTGRHFGPWTAIGPARTFITTQLGYNNKREYLDFEVLQIELTRHYTSSQPATLKKIK